METNAAVSARGRRALEWIRQLTHFLPRYAGTASERGAAQAVSRWMTDVGLEPGDVQSVAAAPRAGYVVALHAALALLGLRHGGIVGAACCAVAAWSLLSETRRRKRVLSRLLAAPDSVAVVSRHGARIPRRRVVLSAHIDAPQAGLLFSRQAADLFASIAVAFRGKGGPSGPMRIPELAVCASLVLVVARGVPFLGTIAAILSPLVMLTLLVMCLLALQWAWAAPSPGANDNASAVAAMLTCAERLLPELPEDVELWVVGTGAEEVGCCGMRAFVEQREAWPKDTTYFVNFECVGGGQLSFIRSEGVAGRVEYPTSLLSLAERVAATGGFGSVTPTELLAGTDGHVPARLGYPTLSLISLEANGVPRNYHRLEDIVEDIDSEVVIRAADFGAAVALAALRGDDGDGVSRPATWQEPF